MDLLKINISKSVPNLFKIFHENEIFEEILGQRNPRTPSESDPEHTSGAYNGP